GNLHWGGSGKTPLVAAIAAHLRDEGRRVAVLSRGYRRRSRGVRFATLGDGLAESPREVGDEPAMLASILSGVPIVVGADRFAAGRAALAEIDPPPDILLLDDGFSHIRLARNLDILTFPRTDPFAGGRLAPGGRLREPLASSSLAAAVVLTGAESLDPALGRELAEALRPFGFHGHGFTSQVEARTEPPLEAGTPVLLVTGIARPGRVATTAASLGLDVLRHLRFSDHHSYPERSVVRINEAAAATEATCVVTTSKDRHKVQGRTELPLVELRIEARFGPEFWTWLDQEGSISKSGSPLSTD
ncbi:MAG: tetraacyldisaccharide 4'-kinase, partial [Acidobacteria bacterium]|nr:tetraacyldisaccharide 4'-kinase [Acidobacteriota bacterium]